MITLALLQIFLKNFFIYFTSVCLDISERKKSGAAVLHRFENFVITEAGRVRPDLPDLPEPT